MIDFKTDEERRLTSKDRRDMLRAANKCINGPLEGNVGAGGIVHGPVVGEGKCQRCLDVKARSRKTPALLQPRYKRAGIVEVELDTTDALAVAQTMRSLVVAGKLPPGVGEVFARVGNRILEAARGALPTPITADRKAS